MQELRKIARRRERVEAEYKAAVLAAVAEHGYKATSEILGQTRQAVRQQVLRWEREPSPPADPEVVRELTSAGLRATKPEKQKRRPRQPTRP